ncbi:MAG: GNAT family N-acetyltransferase [Myxococcales bacterium]|nr:GNAT family N-acetyltransferase [Myxococcales bacterium]
MPKNQSSGGKTKPKGRVVIRNWTIDDLPGIVSCQIAAYPDLIVGIDTYDARKYGMQMQAFPEGQFLAEIEGTIVGLATSLIVQLDDLPDDYRYNEITGSGSFSTHTPHGDTLYGADIAVHPDFRGRGISKKLYVARKRLMKRYNLRRMMAYGRIPGFKDWVGKYTADEYVEKVEAGELKDSALNAHLSAGYTVRRTLVDYVHDKSSVNICTVLEMLNPDFKPERRKVAAAPLRRVVRKARVCTAQYLLRDMASWDEFERTTEYFVETADTYLGHFLLLPEMFTAQLLTLIPRDWDDRRQIVELTKFTKAYLELFTRLAKRYDLFIIAGSHPVERDGLIYNVAHLFTPTGEVCTQDKLHPTPYERKIWDMRPGSSLNVFETPYARIAIQVCYDVEFPEPTRLLTLAGTEILFVPYSTDDRKGHYRVSYCARARAIENSIYVVTSGNCGTILNRSYLLNYAESAVYTPSDYGFPPHAEAGRADPNVETVVVADLDMGSLMTNREQGSTRPLYDRRTDLYQLTPRLPVIVHKLD